MLVRDRGDLLRTATHDALIVGAGFTGLLIADRLYAHGMNVVVVEARPRLGGRALTVDRDGALATSDCVHGCFDLGATWIWSDQPKIQQLLNELGITIFPQHEDGEALRDQGPGRPPRREELPAKDIVTLRFTGGALGLCQRLAGALPSDRLLLGHQVLSITAGVDGVRIQARTATGETPFTARRVVVTLPPQLALASLRFSPKLPGALEAAMAQAPTWMGKSMKCVMCYSSAFWRAQGLSGIATSDDGPVKAFHDATTLNGRYPALFGFFSDDATIRVLSLEERQALVLRQMARLYGPEASRPIAYLEHDWSREGFTVLPEHVAIDADAPDGDPLLRRPLWDGRLYLTSTETAARGAGYLEGAVESAEGMVRRLLADLDLET